jgi:chitin-binding protein
VILGVWTVDDTAAAFHSVVDVDIENVAPPADGWKAVSAIVPNQNLKERDKVKARAFRGGQEIERLSTSVTIHNEAEGAANVWSRKLATAINAKQIVIKAGVRNQEGEIQPQLGRNDLFAKAESGVTSFELSYDRAMPLPPELQVLDLQATYEIKPDAQINGAIDPVKVGTHVTFGVQSNDKVFINATLYNEENQTVGGDYREAASAGESTVMDIAVITQHAKPGKYTLHLSGGTVGKPEAGLTQLTKTIELVKADNSNAFDFVYPKGLGLYEAGDRVKAADGKVYECKPWPYTGWCNDPTAAVYAPGAGSNWQDAWIRK